MGTPEESYGPDPHDAGDSGEEFYLEVSNGGTPEALGGLSVGQAMDEPDYQMLDLHPSEMPADDAPAVVKRSRRRRVPLETADTSEPTQDNSVKPTVRRQLLSFREREAIAADFEMRHRARTENRSGITLTRSEFEAAVRKFVENPDEDTEEPVILRRDLRARAIAIVESHTHSEDESIKAMLQDEASGAQERLAYVQELIERHSRRDY